MLPNDFLFDASAALQTHTPIWTTILWFRISHFLPVAYDTKLIPLATGPAVAFFRNLLRLTK